VVKEKREKRTKKEANKKESNGQTRKRLKIKRQVLGKGHIGRQTKKLV
jgi:hypothetical protein